MTHEVPPPTVAGFIGKASAFVAEALRYWEPRRVFYNLVLAAVVAGHMVTKWSSVREYLSINYLLLFFFLAILANVCYCAVYAVDLFVRFSGLEGSWQKARPVVLIVGTAFAGVIAHFFGTGILSVGYNP